MILWTFGIIFCGFMSQKQNRLKDIGPVVVTPTQHFTVRASYHQSNKEVTDMYSCVRYLDASRIKLFSDLRLDFMLDLEHLRLDLKLRFGTREWSLFTIISLDSFFWCMNIKETSDKQGIILSIHHAHSVPHRPRTAMSGMLYKVSRKHIFHF